jgi:hypothetical protein
MLATCSDTAPSRASSWLCSAACASPAALSAACSLSAHWRSVAFFSCNEPVKACYGCVLLRLWLPNSSSPSCSPGSSPSIRGGGQQFTDLEASLLCQRQFQAPVFVCLCEPGSGILLHRRQLGQQVLRHGAGTAVSSRLTLAGRLGCGNLQAVLPGPAIGAIQCRAQARSSAVHTGKSSIR